MSFSENPKKLHYQAFGLNVIEYSSIIVLIEDEIKCRVIYNLLDFAYVQVIVDVLKFKAELQILIVKDSNVSLGIIFESLNNSCAINQVGLKKRGQIFTVWEYFSMISELIQRSHFAMIY